MDLPKLASVDTCTGCMACLDSCHQNAISQVKGEDGHLYIKVDADKCIGCKKCEHICQKMHDGTYANNKKTSKPYAVYSENERLYQHATSGGIFAAIAQWMLCHGGVVYGASYSDGIYVQHRRIDSLNNLYLLQGSKYLESNLRGVYKAMADDLKDGKKVLFSGVGCQVAGVLSYFEHHKFLANLYTCDIVCGGVPSSLLIEAYAEHTKDFQGIHHFRDKVKYEFAYWNINGEVIIHKKALPISGFESLLTNRYACYHCEYVGLHRQSDWTIGDYWGDSLKDKHRSVCICHNDRAQSIIHYIENVSLEDIDWNFVVCNPRIVNGIIPFANRFERKHIGYIFKHFSYRVISKIYGTEISKVDVVWFLYKIYKYLRFKKYFKASIKKAQNIINQ